MKKILIVRMDHIGDLLCSTPCIRAIKQAYPDSFIGILCTSRNYVAVENNPYINARYISTKKIFHDLKLVHAIRKEKYDEVIVINSHSSTACFFTMLLGIKNRIAVSSPHKKFKKLYTKVLPKAVKSEHMINTLTEPFEALNIYADSQKLDYFLPEEKIAWAKREFPKKENVLRFAVFIGNVKKPHKHWGVENYVRLCEKLMDKPNVEIYVWGGQEETKYFHLFEHLKSFPQFHFLCDLTFAEGGAFLLQCDALIVGSTGPTHLASALDVPVLSIITDYEYRVWRPLGEQNKYVCPQGAIVDSAIFIPLEDVIEMVDTFIAENKKG